MSMFRCLTAQAVSLASRQPYIVSANILKPQRPSLLDLYKQARLISIRKTPAIINHNFSCDRSPLHQANQCNRLLTYQYLQPLREFHAKGSKVRYLDFRYRMNTSHLRSHLIIIRRQKMKKHKRRKWRRKYKCLLAKVRLKREIAKEKTFRVELLTMIKRAEQFDPKEYALNKINELNRKSKELTREERFEELKELIRKNRYQVDYIKPKHRRAEISVSRLE